MNYHMISKAILLVNEVDNKGFLTGLLRAMYDELSSPKPKKEINIFQSVLRSYFGIED